MKRTLSMLLVMALVMTAILPAAYAEDNFGTGSVKDNVYWNETMKIGCELDETWYFYSEEEILQVNGTTAELLDNNIEEIMESGGVLTDMFAQNMETGATVNVVFERLSLTNTLLVNEDTYIKASQSSLQDTFEKIGLENIQMTQQDVEFLGEEHQSLLVTGSVNGVSVYELLVVMKSGRNITVVTVFSLDEAEIDETLNSFFNTLD